MEVLSIPSWWRMKPFTSLPQTSAGTVQDHGVFLVVILHMVMKQRLFLVHNFKWGMFSTQLGAGRGFIILCLLWHVHRTWITWTVFITSWSLTNSSSGDLCFSFQGLYREAEALFRKPFLEKNVVLEVSQRGKGKSWEGEFWKTERKWSVVADKLWSVLINSD